MKKELEVYREFVDGVTSETSKNNKALIKRIEELDSQGINIARLLTGGIGLNDEGGETLGIVKKLIFHRKDFDEETKKNLIKELGDVSWYWINICTALNVDPYEVLEQNINKLKSRYPNGFDPYNSANKDESKENGDFKFQR